MVLAREVLLRARARANKWQTSPEAELSEERLAQKATPFSDADKSSQYMEPWRTLREAIPDRMVRLINKSMRVSYDYVLKWRREPESDETPDGTGMLSPLDRLCELIDAVFLHHPHGASLIVEHVVLHHERLVNTHSIEAFEGNNAERSRAACDLLQRATNAVCALTAENLSSKTIDQLVSLRDTADRALKRVGKELYHPSDNNQPTDRSN